VRNARPHERISPVKTDVADQDRQMTSRGPAILRGLAARCRRAGQGATEPDLSDARGCQNPGDEASDPAFALDTHGRAAPAGQEPGATVAVAVRQ